MTVIDDQLEVVEAAIVILFTFCSVSISNPEEKAFTRPEQYNFQGIRFWLRHSFMPFAKMLTDLGLNLYWTWFWFVGIEKQKLSPCTGYAFFFSKVSMFGWFRTLASIVTVSMVVLDLFLIARVLSGRQPLPGWVSGLTKCNSKSPSVLCAYRSIGLLVTLAIVGFYALSVELMIYWNSIQGVNTVLGSVGQMVMK